MVSSDMEVRNWWKTRRLVELFVTQDDLCKSHHCLNPVTSLLIIATRIIEWMGTAGNMNLKLASE
jgi:hypothetical protein